MNVKSKHCKFTYHSFFYSKGNVAQCCMQEPLLRKLDWSNVADLTTFSVNNPEFKKVRKQGVFHSACKSCRVYEENNMPSMRTQNMYYRDEVNTEVNTVVDIRHVDLRLSNKCNLQCKMCYPTDSDQLVKLSRELTSLGISNPLEHQLPDNASEDISKLLDLVLQLPNLEAIRFAGGEPFIMPEVEQFLYKLVAQGRTNINIEFMTNCTSAKPKVIALLEQFDHVDLMCSIDAVEDTLEYQRYPARWKTIETNFKRMYNSKCNTRIVPCIGLLNYLDLDRFFAWAAQHPKSIVTFNEIQEPSFLNFRLIPSDIRPKTFNPGINVSHNWYNFISNKMHETREPTQDECNKLLAHSRMWDYRCNEKFLDRYPWASYIIEKAKV
jgi:sulfatase maturation enzyme AslB (radical SAM superfamily)